MNVKLFIFFSLSIFSYSPVISQVFTNCAEEILKDQYKSTLVNTGDYNTNMLKYRSAIEHKKRHTNTVDSLIHIINNEKFSQKEKTLFHEIIQLAVNDTSGDVYSKIRGTDQSKVLKLNKVVPLSFIYELERRYTNQSSSEIINEVKTWANELCKFSFHPINYYRKLPDSVFKSEIEIYKFNKNEIIADIGAGSGYFEKGLSKYSDDLTVYVNDIDSLKHTSLETKLAFLSLNDGKNITYITVLGNERSSHLPPGIFDKIIIRNTSHHFTYPNEMLQDIKRLLKKDGKLFIVDILVDEVEKSPKCQLHIPRKDFLNYLSSNDFILLNEVLLQYDGFKCFEFQLIR